MKGWIQRSLLILSTVIFFGAAALWIHSYWAYDWTGWERNQWTHSAYTQDRYGVAAVQGQFWLKLTTWRLGTELYQPENWNSTSESGKKNLAWFLESHPEWAKWTVRSIAVPDKPASELARQSIAGFAFFQPPPDTGRWIAVPAWLIVALAAVMPLRSVDQRLRARKSPEDVRFAGPVPA
jgi:hypothetical protein